MSLIENVAFFIGYLPCNTHPSAARRVSLLLFFIFLSGFVVELLLYVHRNRRFIRDGSPGRPPPLSHSS